jgi:hypothetical protein
MSQPSENPGAHAARVQEIAASDAALAEQLVLFLKKQDIPAVAGRDSARGKIMIPVEFASQAMQVLVRTPGLVFESEPAPQIRRHDPSRDKTIMDHPVLKQTTVEHQQRGAAAIEELMNCVTHGVEAVRGRAVYYLSKIGPEARPALDRLLVTAVAFGSGSFVNFLMREGRVCDGRTEEKIPEALRPILQLTTNQDPNVRLLAVRVLGALRMPDGVDAVAKALLDEVPEVAIEADDVFLHWGAPDERFEPDWPADRKQAVAQKRAAFRPSRTA